MDYTTNTIVNGAGLGIVEQYATVHTTVGICFLFIVVLIVFGVFDPPNS